MMVFKVLDENENLHPHQPFLWLDFYTPGWDFFKLKPGYVAYFSPYFVQNKQ